MIGLTSGPFKKCNAGLFYHTGGLLHKVDELKKTGDSIQMLHNSTGKQDGQHIQIHSATPDKKNDQIAITARSLLMVLV